MEKEEVGVQRFRVQGYKEYGARLTAHGLRRTALGRGWKLLVGSRVQGSEVLGSKVLGWASNLKYNL
jgi:integrase